MPTLYRAQVSYGMATDQPQDWMTNTLHFRHKATIPADTVALANDLAQIYMDQAWLAGFNNVRVKWYDLEDAMPRAPRADVLKTKAGSLAAGTHEVALCLSYFADRNSPRRRGRVYFGPFQASDLQPRPSDTLRNNVLQMGTRFAGLGGADVDWVVFSPTSSAGGGLVANPVTDTWVDDAWDTQRSRGRAPTKRVTAKPGA